MASSSGEDPLEENPSSVVSPEELPNWLELPRDVTASILSRLGAIDILMNAQKVCSFWFKICKDPQMWFTIDMSNDGDVDSHEVFEDLCRIAINRSSGQLVDINLEHFGSDDLLEYITTRSSQIKRLRLAFCDDISNEVFIETTAKLPLLEELDLTQCDFSPKTVGTIGRYCPQLKSFKLNRHPYGDRFDDYDTFMWQAARANLDAEAIAENMPTLCHLQLIGNPMTDVGLSAILEGCPHLESLDLRECFYVKMRKGLEKKCAEQVKFLRLPWDDTQDCGFYIGTYDFPYDKIDNLSWNFPDIYLDEYGSGDDYFEDRYDDSSDYDD